MQKKLIASALFVATAAVVGFYPLYHSQATPGQDDKPISLIAPLDQPKIQLAILLDTSSSMSGLIDQTRNQLWQIVNEFARAKHNGVTPMLEVAVYEYGNNRLASATGYIRQVTGLTGELDQVSEALFSLSTNGGDEYCGYVINTAVTELNWSKSEQDIKTIFIAGNEPFTQGPVPFQRAIENAKARGITVNTIHAGDHGTGASTGWREGAVLAGGDYMSIDHNHKVAHINAPQDQKLAELNAKLNETYIPYGAEGKEKAQRQAAQDSRSEEISAGLLAKRAQSKASKLYENSSWDLVDAVENQKVDLEEVAPASLPAPMRDMAPGEREAYVVGKAEARKKIKEEILQLSKERDAYVAEQKQQAAAPAPNTVNEAIAGAVRKEAEKKNYVFEK